MAGDRRLSRPDSSLPDWEVPDTTYRPIPIVWFTGALLAQMVTLTAIFLLFSRLDAAYTSAIAGVTTGIIGAWTWRRGMSKAATGWKIATIAMLVAVLALVLLSVSGRL